MRYISFYAKKENSLLIHYSTDYVFDGKKESPYEIFDTPQPLNVYGKSKLEGENNIIKESTLYIII